jgi:hypothetical protein
MAIDCNNPKNDQERSLCSCYVATQANKTAADTYAANSAAYAAKSAAHERESGRHDKWRNMSGEFANWATRKKQLEDERKQTGEGINPQSGWCKNDYGDGWESVERWANWANVGRMNCGRTAANVSQTIWNEGYNTAEPIVPPHPGNPPQFSLVSNIQCCSQIFSDINVNRGDLSISEISQNCDQRINAELNNPSVPAAPTQPPTQPPTEDTKEKPTEEKLTEENQMFLIIIIIILLSLSSISFIPIIFFSMSSNNIKVAA